MNININVDINTNINTNININISINININIKRTKILFQFCRLTRNRRVSKFETCLYFYYMMQVTSSTKEVIE